METAQVVEAVKDCLRVNLDAFRRSLLAELTELRLRVENMEGHMNTLLQATEREQLVRGHCIVCPPL